MLTISLEIGSSAVKLAAASFDPEVPEAVSILAIEEEPLTNNCVRYGRIQNVEDVKTQTLAALQRLMQRPELKDHNITGVYTSIGGRSLMSVTTSACLEIPEERLIDEDIIDRLQADAIAKIPQDKEAYEIIPLGYKINGISTPRPIGSYGSKVSGDFTVVVCNQLNERNIHRVVKERLNLDICGFTVRPLAIANACLSIDDTQPGCMLVDFGAETTTVAIFKDQALRYIATIPLGSAHITRDLAAVLGTTNEKAEAIKLSVANAYPDNKAISSTEQIEIDSVSQSRAYEIVANVMATIGYAGYEPADLRAGIIVTGRGSKLRNLIQLIKEQSRLDVSTATLNKSIKITDAAINPSDNIDIISALYASSQQAANPNATPCVEQLTPAEPEIIETETPETVNEPVWRNDNYDDDDKPNYIEADVADLPDDNLFNDDPETDEEDLPGNKVTKKTKESAKPAKKTKTNNRFSFSGIMNKVSALIQSESDGNDIDD